MSVLTVRGGVPFVKRITADTTGQRVKLPFNILYLIVRNRDAAQAARLYFTEQDFTDDANYVDLPIAAAETPYGEWQGPVETTDARPDVFVRGVSDDADVELVAFQRRG